MRAIIVMLSVVVLAWAIGVQADSEADESSKSGATAQAASAVTKKFPVFVPRESGSPSTRIGGATRGAGLIRIPAVDAFAPAQIGHTLDAQPSLFWYVSHATEQRIDFTLRGSDSEKPVVQTTLPGPTTAGVQRIDLADFDASLTPGVPYVWFVSLIPDADRRSEDRIAGGAVERLADSSELDAQITAESADRRVFVLAENGIWYDAIRSATDRIDDSPQGALAREQRAALLEQVGLVTLAQYDRDAGGGQSE